MKYQEDTAAEIAAKHNLSPATIRTWKNRGSIPDMYSDENYTPPKPAELKHTLRAIEILSMPEINVAGLISLDKNKVRDVLSFHMKSNRGKTQNFSAKEIAGFRSELTRLRNLLREFTQRGNQDASRDALKAIITCKQIKHYVLFSEHRKMLSRLYRGLAVYEDEMEMCKILTAALYDKLKF